MCSMLEVDHTYPGTHYPPVVPTQASDKKFPSIQAEAEEKARQSSSDDSGDNQMITNILWVDQIDRITLWGWGDGPF